MELTDRIVREARAWCGTPYVHQASRKGAGTDCLGLVRGVWRAIYGRENEVPPPYTADWGEWDGAELLLDAAYRHLLPVDHDCAGCVLVFRMHQNGPAKHLGILCQTGTDASFVHAYDRHGVVESPLSEPWRRRIAARFAFPQLN